MARDGLSGRFRNCPDAALAFTPSFAHDGCREPAFARIQALQLIQAFVCGLVARRAFGQSLDAFRRRPIAVGVIEAINRGTIRPDVSSRNAFHCRFIADVIESVAPEETVRIARRTMAGRYTADA